MADVLARVDGFPVPDGQQLDFQVHAGEVVRVIGPNGSGKTSLLRALASLDAPIRPHAVDSTSCGFSMQTAMDSLIGLTVAGEFRMREQTTPDLLLSFADRDVATLSSGEAREVSLHAALGKTLLLLDEPVEGLDVQALQRLQGMVQNHRNHGAVVVVDHGETWVDVADRTIDLGSMAAVPLSPFQATPSPAILTLNTVPLRAGVHALTGPNGCGKTTNLRRLAGLDASPPTHNNVRMLPVPATALMTGTSVTETLDGCDQSVVENLVHSTLLDRHPLHLSGGETQRVALARVLGVPAQVYLLDEPEAHLDGPGRHALCNVLQQRVDQGACVLAATHNAELISAANTVVPLEAA